MYIQLDLYMPYYLYIPYMGAQRGVVLSTHFSLHGTTNRVRSFIKQVCHRRLDIAI